MDLVPRSFKYGPTKTTLGQPGSVVDVVLLGLTIVGSGGILVGLALKEFRTGSSTVRTRLLSFLVLGDLVMGIVGMISPLYFLIHDKGPPAMMCDLTAFFLIASFWAQYFSAAFLAISTYLILLHPLSKYTRALQRWWYILLPVTWVLSFVASGVAWRVTGFAFGGGFCTYSKNGPKFFGDIYSIAPRAVVLVIIISLYTQLVRFLRRPDKIDAPSSMEAEYVPGIGSSTAEGRRPSRWGERKGTIVAFSNNTQEENGGSRTSAPSDTSDGTKAPAWESIDLAVPNLSGGPTLYSDEETLRRPSARLDDSAVDPLHNLPSIQTTPSSPVIRTRAPTHVFGPYSPTKALGSDLHLEDSSKEESCPHSAPRTEVLQDPLKRSYTHGSSNSSDSITSDESVADSLSAPPLFSAPSSRRPTLKAEDSMTDRKLSLKEIMEVEEPRGGEQQSATQTSSTGVPESMASYMNRKASLLMILFPLAYVALFSVSLVRIICDFVVPEPIAVLSAVSRWMIFSQGIVDGVLYGLVEWKVKRDVRKAQHRYYSHPTQQETIRDRTGSTLGRGDYGLDQGPTSRIGSLSV